MLARRAPTALASAIALAACIGSGCADELGGPLASFADVGSFDAADDATDAGAAADAVDDASEDAAVDAADAADATVDAGGLPPLDPALAEALDARFVDAAATVGAPGVTATVRIGDTLWQGADGVASTVTEAPIVPADRLRVGSVTKLFTAAVVLRLVDRGALELDAPVTAYVDGFDLDDAVTIRALLTHTSGVFNFTDDSAFLNLAAEAAPPGFVIQWAMDHGPVHPAGQGYGYSNTGYYLLGLAIEAASGQTFAEAVRAELLDPLGLADTFVQPDESDAAFVDGHLVGTESTDAIHTSWAWAAGGMISNGADLCVWADALFAGDVVPPALYDAFIAPHVLPDGSTGRHGLGVRHTIRGGRPVVGHTGSTMGFRGELFYALDTGTCVVVLTNDFFARPTDLAQALWAVLP